MLDPEVAVDGINQRFGRHPRARALHAKGILCVARFTPTAAAAALTKAPHFQSEVEALVRLSNGGGDPNVPDFAPDVRGLAISFALPDGKRTDVLAQTSPTFPVKTAQGFVDLVQASEPSLRGALRALVFFAKNPGSIGGLGENLKAMKPPPSFGACTFYAIHAFRFVNAAGADRHVRYTFVPEEKMAPITPKEAKARGRDYLSEDLAKRLADKPVSWTLRLQLAEPTDIVDDPRINWPSSRETIEAGTLSISAIHADQTEADRMVFDPMRLCEGIEAPGDPILHYRPGAYSASFNRRAE